MVPGIIAVIGGGVVLGAFYVGYLLSSAVSDDVTVTTTGKAVLVGSLMTLGGGATCIGFAAMYKSKVKRTKRRLKEAQLKESAFRSIPEIQLVPVVNPVKGQAGATVQVNF